MRRIRRYTATALFLLYVSSALTGCGKSVKIIGNTQAVTQQNTDTTAPVFTKAENFTIEEGDSISYMSHVAATDDSGQEPQITVDNSAVKADVPGTYQVVYTATDAAGNSSTATVELTVTSAPEFSEKKIGPMVDEIIAKVTNDSMTKYQKAEALYRWVKKNVGYSAVDSNTENIWEGAYHAIKEKRGDCFTSYAIYAALLTRCDIENMCVTRYNGPSNHYWNLVNFGEGWYHCDTGVGSSNYRIDCFMQTDAQLESYNKWDEECHEFYQFDKSKYPERATKIIYGPTAYGQ